MCMCISTDIDVYVSTYLIPVEVRRGVPYSETRDPVDSRLCDLGAGD